jgi:hypothetical protein
MAKLPSDVPTYLAWRFESVLPGAFRRDKEDYADIDFPILAPLPIRKASTEPIEGKGVIGPFVYFVEDRDEQVHYVGKSQEKTVIKRWVRPGLGGPATHYWTHTNKTAGCVRRIAEGIQTGRGPFYLRFLSSGTLPSAYLERFNAMYPHQDPLERIEKGFMSLLRPVWNDPKSYR